MEKRIIINNIETSFWIEDTGRVRNERTGTWLKGAKNKGYLLYNIYSKGKQHTLYAHRLVAEYFLPNPDNLPIVHHIDGNKLNNNVVNLEWVDEASHGNKHRYGHHGRQIKIDDKEINLDEMKSFRGTPYYASKDGQIYNLNKKIKMRQEKSGKYSRVQCYYGLNGKRFLVHRIVWECFNGPIPAGLEINHIDNDPNNNALDNLELISHSENCQKARHGNVEVYSLDVETLERTEYSSINQAALATLGYRDGVKIPKVIESDEVFKGCYWYYKE